MIFKALLIKSKVNLVSLYPLELNQLAMLWSLCCLLTCHARESSTILLEGIGKRRESIWFFKTIENKGIFKAPVYF